MLNAQISGKGLRTQGTSVLTYSLTESFLLALHHENRVAGIIFSIHTQAFYFVCFHCKGTSRLKKIRLTDRIQKARNETTNAASYELQIAEKLEKVAKNQRGKREN